MLSDILERYGQFVGQHPYIVLGLIVLVTFGAVKGVSALSIEETRFIGMFPQDLEVIRTMRFVQDQFGGADSVNIVIELDPEESYSAIMDVRDPQVIEYADILARKSEKVENVIRATSIADVLKARNDGKLPNSKRTVVSMLESSPRSSRYITKDHAMSLVRVDLGNVEGMEEELISDMREVILSTNAPAGIKAEVTGDPAMAVVFKESTGPDMARTTRFSLIGILIIAILLFTSIKHGIIPILSVGMGLLWAFGLMGALGINISATTAGVASMVLGIGIDFAIQVVNRFRQEMHGVFGQERERMPPREAITVTLSKVMVPMSTTTIAALIGFRAMSLAKITVMSELGFLMSLGVLTCMLTAITLVPSLLIIGEKNLRG